MIPGVIRRSGLAPPTPFDVIVDRYLLREVAAATAAVSLVLLAIFLIYSLTRFLADAASGILQAHEVVELTFLKSLIALEVLLPIGLYFGIIVSLGRLYSQLEITALQASGFSIQRLRRPIALLAMCIALAVAALSTVVRPWAYSRIYTLEAQAEAASELERIRPGRFYSFEDGERVVFVEPTTANADQIKGIFVRTRKPDGLEVITAAQGRIEQQSSPDRYRLILDDAQIFTKATTGPDFWGRFRSLTVYLDTKPPRSTAHKAKGKPTAILRQSAEPKDRAELQWRLSTPVSTLLLALLAMPLSKRRPRQGGFTRLPVALAIYAVYFNLLGIGKSWVEQETFPTLWWAPGLLAFTLVAWWAARRAGKATWH
jgi:lipopolysaccharide export system permease protein